jgi:hypothetical protein
MNRVLSIGTLSILLVGSARTLSAAAVKEGFLHVDNAKRAEISLQKLDQQISEISDNAFVMNEEAREVTDAADYKGQRLMQLKDEVNCVGHELAAMNVKSTELPQWETAALEQLLPMMDDAASRLNEVILAYDSNRADLFASGYIAQTAAISTEAEKAAKLLHKDLSFEKAREKEDAFTVVLP